MSAPQAPARIALLPEVVRNQIAAGEVIERPSSVVKELVENALDAGATRIQVDLEEGGARLVRVTDDGCGMGPEDLALAFEAHATSKLRDPEDLLHISSLGFRGEALASMGSVARCAILSRPEELEVGHRIECQGGHLGELREAGGPRGTSIEVRDLFYNTPARRRFLKRTSTELSHCLEAVQRMALAHDGVGFVVTSDGRRAYDVEPQMDFLGRIRRTYGADVAEALVEARLEDGDLALYGYVGSPRISRRDTTRQLWFLNGRHLRDKVLQRILKDSYHGFLEEGRQPVAFLRLALDPAAVDVNVHPAKAEVRFRDQRRMFGRLVTALREAVARTDMATPGESMLRSRDRRLAREEDPRQAHLPTGGGTLYPVRRPSEPTEVREVEGRTFEPGGAGAPVADPGPAEAPTVPGAEAWPAGGAGPDAALEAARSSRESWSPVDDLRGPYLQVDRTYLLRAVPGGFEIVDQHALHERLTYELLRRDVRANRVEVQRLLVPELVELSRADLQLLSGHLESFGELGIELAAFGEATVAVHGLPARLRRPDAEGLVRDLVEILGRTGKAPQAEEVLEEVLHCAACRSSIMAGDELTQDEIRSLLERAAELETDQTCPHARPTRVRFTVADLERAFHRR